MSTPATDLFRSASVSGLAVVVDDGPLAKRGIDADAATLEPVLRAARQLLRDTTPAIDVVDLRFGGGRAVIGTIDGYLVLVRTNSPSEAPSVLRDATADAREIRGDLVRTVSEPGPPTDAGVRRAHVTSAMNAVLAEARKHLGGPVIRNYLKKAKSDASELVDVLPGLDGQVSDPSAVAPATIALGRAAGEWLRSFLERASVVAPELSAIDIVAVTSEQDRFVRPLLFYSAFPTRHP